MPKNKKISTQNPKRHDELDAIFKIINQNPNKEAYEKALTKLDSMSNKQSDVWIIAKGNCLRKLQRFDEMIAVYKTMTNWNIREKALIPIAHAYAYKNDYQKQLEVLLTIPRLNHSPGALNALSHCYHSLEDYEASITAAKQMLQCEMQPEKRNFWLKAAYLQIGMNNEKQCFYEEAERSFLKIPELEKDKASIICLGRFYQNSGQYQKAVDTLTKTLEVWPNDKDLLTTLGFCYAHMKQSDTAINIFQKIPKWETDEKTLIGIGRIFQKNNFFEEALTAFDRISDKDKSKELLTAKAFCLLRYKRFNTALAYFKDIEIRFSTDQNIKLGITSCLRFIGQEDNALALLSSDGPIKDKYSLLQLGNIYLDKKECALAKATYESIPNWETDKSALIGLSTCLRQSKEFDESMNMLLRIPEKQRDEVVLYEIALLHQKTGNFVKALSIFTQLSNGKNPKVLIGMAHCNRLMERYEEAISLFKEIESWSKNKSCLLGIATTHREQKQYDLAIESCQLIPDYESDKQAQLLLGRICEDMHNYPKAIEWYKKSPDWEKDTHRSIFIARATERMNYKKHGKFDISTYYEGIPNWKTNKKVLLILATSYNQKNDHDKALHYFQLIPNWQKIPDALIGIGRAFQSKKEYDNALYYYKEIPNWESNAHALLGVAHTLEAMGRESEALSFFKKAYALIPNPTTKTGLARCFQKLGFYTEAIETYQNSDWKNQRLSILGLAHCYGIIKDWDKALQTFKIYNYWEQDKDFILGIARVLESMGEYTEAISFLDTIPGYSDDKEFLLLKGHCFELKGDRDSAMLYFEQALALFPEDQDVILALAIVKKINGDPLNAIEDLMKTPQWETNKAMVLAVSRAYETLHEYQKGIELLEKKPEWLEDKQIRLTLGYLYASSGAPDTAIKIYESHANYKTDLQLLLAIGVTYSKMGAYKKARDIYFTIPNWTKHTEVLLALGRSYGDSGYYKHALEVYMMIPQWEKSVEVLLAIGYTYSCSKDYSKAIDTFKSIPNWKKNKIVLLSIAASLIKDAKYTEALDLVRTIPNWEKDEQAIVVVAICNNKQNHHHASIQLLKNNSSWNNSNKWIIMARSHIQVCQYGAALESLSQIPSGLIDGNTSLNIARCYQDMGYYMEALSFIKNSVNWKENRQLVLAVVHIYMDMNKFTEALNAFSDIDTIETDITALITKARCCAGLGSFQEALQILTSIPSWETNDRVLIPLSRIYQDMGRNNDAIATFKKIPGWTNNEKAVLGIAHTHELLGNTNPHHYVTAINLFQSIPNWRHNKQILLSLGRCYQKQSDYNNALQSFQSILNHTIDVEAQLAIAHCYIEMEKYQEAGHIFTKLLHNFPDYSILHVQYCQFLVKQNHLDAYKTIESTLIRWPFNPKLYILKVQSLYDLNDPDSAYNILLQASQQFPDHIGIQINIIQHLCIVGNEAAARKKAVECKQRFDSNETHRQINYLIKHAKLIQNVGFQSMSSEIEEPIQINMPDNIFPPLIKSIPGTHYLFGSTLLKLLLGEPIDDKTDRDYMSTTEDTAYLTSKQFRQCPYEGLSNLWTYHDGQDIDFFLISNKTTEKNRALTSDFTICSLAADESGQIQDPLGVGLKDLREKRLRMVGNPHIRLMEDPVRALRAINYLIILPGFKPEINLSNALHEMQIPKHTNMSHIYAVARKHLRVRDNREYVKLLLEYGLLGKFFGLDENKDLEYLVVALNGKVREAAPKLYNTLAYTNHGMFVPMPLPAPEPSPEAETAQENDASESGWYKIGEYALNTVYDRVSHFIWG